MDSWSETFSQGIRGPFRIRPEEIARNAGTSLQSGDNRPGLNTIAGLLRLVGEALRTIYPGDSGIRLPHFTTAQRNALVPVAGEMIWNTDVIEAQIFTGTAWVSIGGTGIPVTATVTPVAGVITLPAGLQDGSLIIVDGPAATDVVVTSIVGPVVDRLRLLFRSSGVPNSIQLSPGGNIALAGGVAYLIDAMDRWTGQFDTVGGFITEVARACGTRVVLTPDALGPQWWSAAATGGSGSPANNTNSLSANIGNNQEQRQFNDGVIDGLNVHLQITSDLVLTQPITQAFRYRKQNSAGSSGAVEMELLQVTAANGDNIAAGTLVEGTPGSTLLAIPVGDLNIMREGAVSVMVDSATPIGNIVVLQLRRDATAGNPDDTFAGNIALELGQLTGVVRRAGSLR